MIMLFWFSVRDVFFLAFRFSFLLFMVKNLRIIRLRKVLMIVSFIRIYIKLKVT